MVIMCLTKVTYSGFRGGRHFDSFFKIKFRGSLLCDSKYVVGVQLHITS
jgi:hypothetical protein